MEPGHGSDRAAVAESSRLVQEAGEDARMPQTPMWASQLQRAEMDRYMLEAGDLEEEVASMELMVESLARVRAHQMRSKAASGTASAPNSTALAELHSLGGSGDVILLARLIMKKICLLGKATAFDENSNNATQKQQKTVTTLLVMKFEGIKRIRDYGNAISRAVSWGSSAEFRELLAANLAYNEELKLYGFDWKPEKKACDQEVGDSLVNVFERMTQEVSVCEFDKAGQCVERVDKYCPEGYASKYRRGFNYLKATAAAPVGYAIGWTITALGGIIVGAAMANPVTWASIATGAAAGFAFQACCVPVDFVIAGAFSAYMGTETSQCKCFESNCRFEPQTNSCEVLAVDDSGRPVSENPFGWLPYPGKRCDYDPGTQKCQLNGCRDEDYSAKLRNGYFGIVGKFTTKGTDTTSVANCISTNAAVSGAWVHSMELNGKANSQTTRNEIYAQLGVAQRAYEQVAFIPIARQEEKPPELPELSVSETTL